MRLIIRTRVEGIENIPGTGPVILAGNHLTFIDSMILPLVCDRTVHFIGKDEYVTGKGIKGRAMAWFFTGAGMIPVDRDGANGGVAALMTGRRILEEGKIFGIYPEGTRSPDGRLYRGRTGIARLTLMTGAPVVPFAMIGTDKLQPGGSRHAASGPGHRPLRRADGVLPLRGHGPRPLRAARRHRLGDGRGHAALGPGVRGHVRDQSQGSRVAPVALLLPLQ